MEEKTFTEILTVSANIAEKGKVELLRELSKKILREISIRDKGVFIIAGVRGSGKTTILSEIYENEKNALFVNAEIVIKMGFSILDVLHYAYTKDYKIFLIDEVHILPNWEKDIKIFYDETKSKIIVSGSSAIALKVKGSELSRRASFYETKPLSFREYLIFKTGKSLPVITISDLVNFEKRRQFEKIIAPYINYYLPFAQFEALPAALFEKNKDVYVNILERTSRYDLSYLREIDASFIENIFRAIKVIATSSPGEISFSSLSSSLGIGVKLVREIIYSLEQAGLIFMIPPFGIGKKAVRKEEKILMPLSFRAALCEYYGTSVPKGGLREDFFIQHVGKCFYFKTGGERRTPDFIVENYVFEVGGPSKGFEQISEKRKAFLVKEGIGLERNEIPLYLFGLLY